VSEMGELVDQGRFPIDATAVGVALSDNGKRVAVATAECKLLLWDWVNLRTAWTGGRLFDCVISGDGEIVVTLDSNGNAQFFYFDSGVRVYSVETGAMTRICALSFTGSYMIAGGLGPHPIQLLKRDEYGPWKNRDWNVTSSGKVRHSHAVLACAISGEGDVFACGGANATLLIGKTDKRKRILAKGHDRNVVKVSVSSDSRVVTSLDEGYRCRVWRADDGVCIRKMTMSPVPTASIALVNSCRVAAHHELRIWDLLDNFVVATSAISPDPVTIVAASGDLETVVIGFKNEQKLQVYSVEAVSPEVVEWYGIHALHRQLLVDRAAYRQKHARTDSAYEDVERESTSYALSALRVTAAREAASRAAEDFEEAGRTMGLTEARIASAMAEYQRHRASESQTSAEMMPGIRPLRMRLRHKVDPEPEPTRANESREAIKTGASVITEMMLQFCEDFQGKEDQLGAEGCDLMLVGLVAQVVSGLPQHIPDNRVAQQLLSFAQKAMNHASAIDPSQPPPKR